MPRPKPPKPMRVALNACGSYAGEALVEALVAQGHTVVALVEPEEEAKVPEAVGDKFTMEEFSPTFVKTVLAVSRRPSQRTGARVHHHPPTHPALPPVVGCSPTQNSTPHCFPCFQCDAVVMQLEGHTKAAANVLQAPPKPSAPANLLHRQPHHPTPSSPPHHPNPQVLVESELHKDKVFVGVSNLMTWAGTTSSKPKLKEGEEPPEGEEEETIEDEDAENPDRREPLERGAVVELDWERRQVGGTFFDNKDKYKKKIDGVQAILPSSPDYDALSECERLVVRSGKEGLKTFVINAGLLYGRGEGDLLHSFFKAPLPSSWILTPHPLPEPSPVGS